MIEQIIKLILREARRRKGKDRIQSIYDVIKEIEKELQRIIENIRLIEGAKNDNKKH